MTRHLHRHPHPYLDYDVGPAHGALGRTVETPFSQKECGKPVFNELIPFEWEEILFCLPNFALWVTLCVSDVRLQVVVIFGTYCATERASPRTSSSKMFTLFEPGQMRLRLHVYRWSPILPVFFFFLNANITSVWGRILQLFMPGFSAKCR